MTDPSTPQTRQEGTDGPQSAPQTPGGPEHARGAADAADGHTAPPDDRTCPARLVHPDAHWACDRPSGHPGGHSTGDRGQAGYQAWTDQAAGAESGGALRAQIAEVLRTTPTKLLDNPAEQRGDSSMHVHGSGHSYDMTCALCRGELDTLTDALLPVVEAHSAAELRRARTLHADTERQLRTDLADEVRKREEAETVIAGVRKAVAERRTEVAEFEADNDPSAWSDAVTVTCGRIDDALRAPAEPAHAAPDTPKETR